MIGDINLNKPLLWIFDLYPYTSDTSFESPPTDRFLHIFSTETAVIAVHNDFARNVDWTDQVSVLVLLDSNAAFDTVDHNIFLDILEYRFGITGLVLKWYQSYLADRTPTFQVGLDRSIAFIIDCSIPQGSVLGPLKFVAYIEELPSVIETYELAHHLYSDDTRIADHFQLTQAAAAITNIEHCVESVHVWCTAKRLQLKPTKRLQLNPTKRLQLNPTKRLQLNPTKSEIIWFGSRTSLHHLHGVHLGLHICADIITPFFVVLDLGVLLNSELSMISHVTKISSVCYYQLRHLKQVRRVLGENITARLVSTFVISRMDYCNAILAGLPQSTMAPFQRVQNAAVRMFKSLGSRDHITEARRNMHGLHIKYRVVIRRAS